MKQILDFFEENNLKFDDIAQIFVNQGPGNFSGLRGSLATAKGVSLSKNLNLFGYDTFLLYPRFVIQPYTEHVYGSIGEFHRMM